MSNQDHRIIILTYCGSVSPSIGGITALSMKASSSIRSFADLSLIVSYYIAASSWKASFSIGGLVDSSWMASSSISYVTGSVESSEGQMFDVSTLD